jgi:hypothetical protein
VEEYERQLAGLLPRLSRWWLTEAEWSSIEDALDRLAGARGQDDAATAGRLTAALLQSGPGRVAGGLDDAMRAPRRPATPAARDVIYRLLRDLGVPPDEEAADEVEARRPDRPSRQ